MLILVRTCLSSSSVRGRILFAFGRGCLLADCLRMTRKKLRKTVNQQHKAARHPEITRRSCHISAHLLLAQPTRSRMVPQPFPGCGSRSPISKYKACWSRSRKTGDVASPEYRLTSSQFDPQFSRRSSQGTSLFALIAKMTCCIMRYRSFGQLGCRFHHFFWIPSHDCSQFGSEFNSLRLATDPQSRMSNHCRDTLREMARCMM